MIKKQRYNVNLIPKDATILVGHNYGKIEENGILYLYNYGCWKSTNKTLDEYNTYYVQESHELTSINEILEKLLSYKYKRKSYYYLYKEFDSYKVVLYEPVNKRYFDNENKKLVNRYRGGEIIANISIKEFPQIEKLLFESKIVQKINEDVYKIENCDDF